MYQILRGESLKAVLPRIILCAVLAVALLAVSAGSLISMLAGPVDLYTLEEEDLSGAYVSFDASQVIVAFATLTSSGGDGGSETLKTYYLLPFGDKYLAVMDRKERNADVLDKAMEQSQQYYMADLETLTSLGAVSGVIRPLETDMPGFMADCIDNYTLPGYEEGQDSTRLVLNYQVELDRVGLLQKPAAVFLGILGLVFLLLGLAQLIVVLTGSYQKQVRAVIGDSPDEEDFQNARKIERVRVGKHVWYPKGPGSRCLRTEDLCWGYAMPEPLVVSKYRWPVALYDMDQKLIQVNFMEQKSCKEFLSAIAAQGGTFRVGYTSQAAEQFQSDFEGFLRDTRAQQESSL